MEAMASGLPSVTTDLAGFGSYVREQDGIESNVPSYIPNTPGMLVLDRARSGFDASVEELADYLQGFSRLTRRQRIDLRNRVEKMAARFDWSQLAARYDEAHDLALSHLNDAAPRRQGSLDVATV